MTHETLAEMKEKVDKAQFLSNNIRDLKKILERRNDIKHLGICAYFDEECEDRLYADLPQEAVKRFIDEILSKEIERLEQEFAVL